MNCSTQNMSVGPVSAHSASAFWAKGDLSWMEARDRLIVASALALWTALGEG